MQRGFERDMRFAGYDSPASLEIPGATREPLCRALNGNYRQVRYSPGTTMGSSPKDHVRLVGRRPTGAAECFAERSALEARSHNHARDRSMVAACVKEPVGPELMVPSNRLAA
jgi:hypothetical protein